MATKESIINGPGFDTAWRAIFRIVEDNYVRRTTYEADIATLVAKIDALEAFQSYDLKIDDRGYLTINLQTGETAPTTSIDSNGHLQLDSNDTAVDKFLKQFTFDVNSDGDLIATY